MEQDYQDSEPLFTLADVIGFFEAEWRTLAGVAVVFTVLGGAAATRIVQAEAAATLPNPGSAINQMVPQTPTAGRAVSYTEFIQRRTVFPVIAAQYDQRQQALGVPLEQRTTWLSSPAWWAANVEAVLALSRNDARSLAQTNGEELKGEATRILNIVIKSQGANEDQAIGRLDRSVNFFKGASLYLELKALGDAWKVEAETTAQTVAAEMARNDVDLTYARRRVTTLENLLSGSGDVSLSSQVIIDVGQAAQTQFLPLRTQLNAQRLAIDSLEEARRKAEDRLARAQVLQAFLAQAEPLMQSASPFDALEVFGKWQAIATEMLPAALAEPEPARSAKRALLESIVSESNTRRITYGVAWVELSRQVSPPSVMKMAAVAVGAGAAGFMLALVGVLVSRQLRSYRAARAAA